MPRTRSLHSQRVIRCVFAIVVAVGFLNSAIRSQHFGKGRVDGWQNDFRNSKEKFLGAVSPRSSSSSPTGPSGCSFVGNEDCLWSTARSLSKLWTQHQLDNEWWCQSKGKLWLIKVPKSASSTTAGLALRIGARHEKQCNRGLVDPSGASTFSSVQWEHGSAREQNLTWRLSPNAHDDDDKTNQQNSVFLMAPIREPGSRALSDIYYHRVSLQQHRQSTTRQPADSFVVKALSQVQENYISSYTLLHPSNASTSSNPISIVESILQSYDFLFLVEDMPTSLVVFAWLTGLPVEDLLVTSSKTSGGWYSQKKRCVRLVQPVQTPAVTDFLESDEWKHKHATDRLLHATVQLSLEKTVKHGIGQPKVDRAVGRLKHLQNILGEVCSNETHMPCSSDGKLQRDLAQQSCLLRDFGCGYRCYDRELSRMALQPDYLWL